MLYTRKGDKGDTGVFGCDQRMSKSSVVAEALGTLDEINSFLGLCKIRAKETGLTADGASVENILNDVQQNLFIVQAELAGADKTIAAEKISQIEKIIDAIEKELPPIKTFFVSGGTELATTLDFARTLARRAERRAVAVSEEGKAKVSPDSLAYLNRLSSLLYCLARYANHAQGVTEQTPSYR